MEIKKIIKQIIDEDILDNGGDILLLAEDFPKSLTKDEKFQALRLKYKDCRRCRLCHIRKNVVFGEGSLNARLLLLTESPWQEEDEQGSPFLGDKGDLLDKILLAINLQRKDVFITDIVKCVSYGDDRIRRFPVEDEILNCQKIFDEQLKLIKPKLIVPLGNTASRAILKTDKEVTQTRGEEFLYRGIKVIPTFHPAYLLRETYAKKMAWEDFQKIRDFLREQ
ncbi:MAG: uracil-DNA glycosylase [bacterium]|nr:uracil-DNA glycosylase [bacterium]